MQQGENEVERRDEADEYDIPNNEPFKTEEVYVNAHSRQDIDEDEKKYTTQ